MRLAPALTCSTLLIATVAFAQPAPESVYAPPELPRDDDGINQGGVHFDFTVSYVTDYMYRGVELFEVPEAEDTLNLQIDTKLSFDLGKLPHPFVGLFVNVAKDDPISDFQEIRPTVGFDWTIKPIIISGGHTNYLYPDRQEQETGEVFLRVGLDEKVLFHGVTLPSPYVMAVYDYDLYDGLYLEAGMNYRLPFDDLGLSFTFHGDIAYVSGYSAQINAEGGGTIPGFFTTPSTTDEDITGLQHWQVGVIAEYSLNKAFGVSTRYGEWSLRGFAFYTDSFDDEIAADNQLWGGAGITFQY
jgi:hypothetical protein